MFKTSFNNKHSLIDFFKNKNKISINYLAKIIES